MSCIYFIIMLSFSNVHMLIMINERMHDGNFPFLFSFFFFLFLFSVDIYFFSFYNSELMQKLKKAKYRLEQLLTKVIHKSILRVGFPFIFFFIFIRLLLRVCLLSSDSFFFFCAVFYFHFPLNENRI